MKKRWEDAVNLVLGMWLFFSPFIMKFTMIQAVINAGILGVAIIVFTVWALAVPKVWEEWVNTGLGLWLVISPWILGFTPETSATWNTVIVGLVVLVMSLKATRPVRRISTATSSRP